MPRPQGTFALTGEPSSTNVVLEWTKPKGPTPTYYDVLRNGGVLVALGGSVLTYTDSAVTAGTTYTYQIRARGSYGGTLALSNSISVTVQAAFSIVVAPVLTGTVGATEVSLSWTAVPDADSYTLQRKTGAGSYSDLVSQTGLTYINTGLTNGTTYTYRVRGTANAGADVGPWSNEVARTPAATVPVAPTLTGTAGDGENSLDWDAVANASTYRLRRTVNGVTTTFPDMTATDYIDDLLTNGVVHQYTVRGITAAGVLGSLSAPFDLTPVAATAPPPFLAGGMNLDYPRNPGAPGTALPSTDGASGLADFVRLDYDGWGSGFNGRMRWESDPLGSGAIVTRFEVRDGDVATHYGGNRAELAQAPVKDHDPGEEAWFTWSWLLGDGTNGDLFRAPSGWCVGFQLHGSTGSPPQAVQFTSAGRQFLRVRQTPSDNSQEIDFAGFNRGQRQYYLMHVEFEDDATGLVEFWHKVGSPPLTNDAPTIVRSNVITLYAGFPGYPKVGIYREDLASDSASYPSVYYLYGYRRAATKADALAKWD